MAQDNDARGAIQERLSERCSTTVRIAHNNRVVGPRSAAAGVNKEVTVRGKCLRQTVAITNDAEEARAVVHTIGKPLMESVYGNRFQQCAAKARMQSAR